MPGPSNSMTWPRSSARPPEQSAAMPDQLRLRHLVMQDLHDTTCNDAVFCARLLELFLSITPSIMQSLERALSDGDRVQSRHASHTLKGNALLIGARRLSELAAALEHAGCQGASAFQAAQLLREEYAQVMCEVAACAAQGANLFKQGAPHADAH